jgi:PAS domain S-box-containing protein
LERKGEQQKEGTGMKILIADDNSNNLYMLEVLLKGAGYEVVMAKIGIEALEKLCASRFDGIVSDILMPTMDGFRLIRECKKDPVLRQIPFIFYTATYTEKKDEDFGLSLGAIRYINKPAESEELLRQIHEAFIDHARSPRDFAKEPGPDEVAFSREYTQRVGDKLEKKERALRESEEKYRLLYENSMDALLFTSPDGSVQAANPAACAMFQRTEEEIIKSGRAGVIDPTDPRLSAALEEWDRTGRFKGELTFLRKDGTRFAGEISSSIFTDRTGQTRSSMIIRDIAERKKAEEAIRESEVRFRSLFNGAAEGILVADIGTKVFLYANPAICSMLGYSEQEMNTRGLEDIHPKEDLDYVMGEFMAQGRGEKILAENIPVLRKDKTVFYADIKTTRMLIDGRMCNVGFFSDITERKNVQERLQKFNEELEKQVAERTEQLNKSLHEKELLLKEIHHRVKNNLQIVASLFNLQSRQISDPETLAMIRESQNRVRAMALVHERLYRSADISSIDLSDYVRFLGTSLFRFYGITPATVRFEINISDIQVDINSAIPLGLIINEILSNSLKHAFPAGRKGMITVTGKKDDGTTCIIVQDDGVGIPESLDWKNTESLGLRLVYNLTEQLRGTIELERAAGTRFTITIPAETEKRDSVSGHPA